MDKTQNNLEEIRQEYIMVLDDAFEDKTYLSEKPQMSEEDALFEQVLDQTWRFFEQKLNSRIKQSNEKYLDDFVNWNDKEFNVIPFKQYLKDKVQRFEQYKSKESEYNGDGSDLVCTSPMGDDVHWGS